ncbi:MAG: hypothetical protein JST85_21810 [Acidobacteria bacterium]|nr:hypothetical protein [Acidobacteriota bacterium]
MGLRHFLSETAKLLYMGVGISDPGTIPRKIDLWKIASGEGWNVQNLSASHLNYKGKEAVRLKSGEVAGLALLETPQLPECKLDLSLAAVGQRIGLLVRAKGKDDSDLVSFQVEAGTSLNLGMQIGSTSATVELPTHLLGEWIGVRVVVASQFTAVFVGGNNMPSLKVPVSSQTGSGDLIGLWVDRNSEAVVADLKYIQSRKRDFE